MHLSLFWLIAIPVGGGALAFIAGFIYLGYCDEYSAKQFIKDAYLEGVKPAPTKLRDIWRRYRQSDKAVPRKIRVNLKRNEPKICHEGPADALARQRVRLARFLEGSSERSTPAIPLQRTVGISQAPMTSLPTDSAEPDSSKPAPNILFSEKESKNPLSTKNIPFPNGSTSSETGESESEKPGDESVEWPYR